MNCSKIQRNSKWADYAVDDDDSFEGECEGAKIAMRDGTVAGVTAMETKKVKFKERR